MFVPVKHSQQGDDRLVSRDQAKRVLAHIGLSKTVTFDFEGIDWIGQAFADEIFRVFASKHPEIGLVAINAAPAVQAMIDRAKDHPTT